MSPLDEARQALGRAHVACLQRGRSEQRQAYESLQNRRVAYGRALGFDIPLGLAMQIANRQDIEEGKRR